MIILVPLTPLAGRLFETNPQAPLAVLFVFLLIGVLAAISLHRSELDTPTVE